MSAAPIHLLRRPASPIDLLRRRDRKEETGGGADSGSRVGGIEGGSSTYNGVPLFMKKLP